MRFTRYSQIQLKQINIFVRCLSLLHLLVKRKRHAIKYCLQANKNKCIGSQYFYGIVKIITLASSYNDIKNYSIHSPLHLYLLTRIIKELF